MPLKVSAVLYKSREHSNELNNAIREYFNHYGLRGTYGRLYLDERGEDPLDIIRGYVEECGFNENDIIFLGNDWEHFNNDEQGLPGMIIRQPREPIPEDQPALNINREAIQAAGQALQDNVAAVNAAANFLDGRAW